MVGGGFARGVEGYRSFMLMLSEICEVLAVTSITKMNEVKTYACPIISNLLLFQQLTSCSQSFMS
jgi:hypothetical protein